MKVVTKRRWLTNIYERDAVAYRASCALVTVCAAPKATEHFSVDALRAEHIVGVYTYGDKKGP